MDTPFELDDRVYLLPYGDDVNCPVCRCPVRRKVSGLGLRSSGRSVIIYYCPLHKGPFVRHARQEHIACPPSAPAP